MHKVISRSARLMAGAAIILAVGGQGAMAQTAAQTDAEWRKQMEATMKALQKEVGDLKAERAKGWAKDSAPASAPTAAQAQENQQLKSTVQGLQDQVIKLNAATEKGKDAVKVTTKGGLKVESEDGKYSFQLGGRLAVDGNWVAEDKIKHGDGTEVRRARLVAQGQITKYFDYKVETEFADQGVAFGLTDALLTFKGVDPFRIHVGQMKEPFSLEEQTSNRFITFMERSLINAFSPGRRIGVLGEAEFGPVLLAAGVFGEAAASAGDTTEFDEGIDYVGRVTYTPSLAKDEFLHMGIGGFYRQPGTATRLRTRPEMHVTDVRYLDTGTLARNVYEDVVAFQPELALVYGPFSIQGEYSWMRVYRHEAAPIVANNEHIDLTGWYAEASMYLTGESRAYKRGKFERTSPKKNLLEGGIGAVQLAARFSELDFNDREASLLEGRERNITVGVNWLPNPYVRFMFNTVFVDTDEFAINNSGFVENKPPFASGPAGAPTAAQIRRFGDEDPIIFGTRAQVDF